MVRYVLHSYTYLMFSQNTKLISNSAPPKILINPLNTAMKANLQMPG